SKQEAVQPASFPQPGPGHFAPEQQIPATCEPPGAEPFDSSTAHKTQADPICWTRPKTELKRLLRALGKRGFISGNSPEDHLICSRSRKDVTRRGAEMLIWEKSAKSCAVLFVELHGRGFLRVQKDPSKHGAKSDAMVLMEQVSEHFLWKNPKR